LEKKLQRKKNFIMDCKGSSNNSSSSNDQVEMIYVLQLEEKKIYVGKTKNVQRRLDEHRSGKGCAWTSKFKVLDVIDQKKCQSKYDEENTVLEYMHKYGIDHVRGGSLVTVELTDEEYQMIQRQIDSINTQCFKCHRPGHCLNECRCGKKRRASDKESKEEEEEESKDKRPKKKPKFSRHCQATTLDGTPCMGTYKWDRKKMYCKKHFWWHHKQDGEEAYKKNTTLPKEQRPACQFGSHSRTPCKNKCSHDPASMFCDMHMTVKQSFSSSCS
jgi:predicted GIY-YIG superfamily endonuclease